MSPKVGGIFLALAAWTAGLLVVAHALDLWTTGQTGDAVLWYAGTGVVLIVNSVAREKRRSFFRRTATEAVGVGLMVEGFVNLGVLPLLIELLLLPFVAFLAMLLVVAVTDDKNAILRPYLEGVLGIIGASLLAYGVVRLVTTDDPTNEVRTIMVPVWLTLGAMPFLFAFSLSAAYEQAFSLVAVEDSQGRRRSALSKLALVATLRARVGEVWDFAGSWPAELGRARSWREARGVARRFQEDRRQRIEQEQAAAERLVRLAGVEGEDEEGRRLDQREFEETRRALQWLATAQMGWYQNEQWRRGYRDDLLEMLRPFRSLPEDDGIELHVAPDGQAWWAGRRTITGWCLAIGAAGPPPDQWLYDGPNPPRGFPGEDPAWGGPFGIDAHNW
jgi:hypothetical protein